MLDLEPATQMLAAVVAGVRDDQLTAPTPCQDSTVGDLLDHVGGLALAFTIAATKTTPPGGSRPGSADASQLDPDWRVRIPASLVSLANAWRDEAAWAGVTEAGGLDLPAELAGVIALNEVVVHGWDIAAATGQPFSCEPYLVAAAHGFVSASAAQNPNGTPGLFGPPFSVPEDAPILDRLIGVAGRDPAWSNPRT